MAAGRYEEPIYVAAGDALRQLASTFNSIRQEMGSRLVEMRDTNQRLSTVLSAMNDGVIATDESQQVLVANRPAGELLTFSPEAAEGKTLLELVRSHTRHDLVVRLLASHGQQEV